MQVRIDTNVGPLIIELDAKTAPSLVCNFVKLVKVGYYDWCLVHRVDRDFVIQMGDASNTGRGGDSILGLIKRGWQGPGDTDQEPLNLIAGKTEVPLKKGQVAMVTMNTDSLGYYYGSQFFICMSEQADLKGCPLGCVVEGHEVLDRLNRVPVDAQLRPLEDLHIRRAELWPNNEDSFPDPPGMPTRPDTTKPSPSFLAHRRISIRRDVVEVDEVKVREMRLAILGDEMGEVNEKRLFIARLNPLTKAADLSLIFSRFGPILECELVKDRQTGNSLGYGFIEFANKQDCELAYERMQNVIIDDRRILVDFAQTAKGRGARREEDRRRDPSPRRNLSRRRDPSPRRRDFSPRRRDNSPRRRDGSPRKREYSPRRR